MTPLFQKLNFKHHDEICILQYPPKFQKELDAMKEFTTIRTGISDRDAIDFALVFVKTKAEIDHFVPANHKKLEGDGIIWFSYPKKSSKKYTVEINRDVGWDIMLKLNLEGVRAVAIDKDWSALRFRKTKYINR